VILGDVARKILRGQIEGHAGDVVLPRPDGRPYRLGQIGKVFRRAFRGGGLKDFRFHDLHHNGATMALNKDSPRIVMALGGRKTDRMMRR
jgi:integrase